MFPEPFDGSSLAGGVASFEDNGNLLAFLFDPTLNVKQLDL